MYVPATSQSKESQSLTRSSNSESKEKRKVGDSIATNVYFKKLSESPAPSPSAKRPVFHLDLKNIKKRHLSLSENELSLSVRRMKEREELHTPEGNKTPFDLHLSRSGPLLVKKIIIESDSPPHSKRPQIREISLITKGKFTARMETLTKKRHAVRAIDNLSLFTPQLVRERMYFPILEYKNLQFYSATITFQAEQRLKKKARTFNKNVIQFLKQSLENFIDILKMQGRYHRYDVTVSAIQRGLEAICKEEICKVISDHRKNSKSFSFIVSPRLEELLKIIKESGLLLKPILERLIFLGVKLVEFHKIEKEYTDWTRSLHQLLLDLLSPDRWDVGHCSESCYGKKLDFFLNKIEELYEGAKGPFNQAILSIVLGDTKEERKQLLRYLRSWTTLSDDVIEKTKLHVKTWNWDCMAFLDLKNLQHEWYQHPRQEQNLNDITIFEILRCFANEDNGLRIIPNKIEINDSVLYDEDVKTPFLNVFDFLVKFTHSIYKAGLCDYSLSKLQVMKDVEILKLNYGTLKSSQIKRAITKQIYPIVFSEVLQSSELQELMAIPAKNWTEADIGKLIPLGVKKFLRGIGIKTKRTAYLGEYIFPILIEDLKALSQAKGKKKEATDACLLARLRTHAEQDLLEMMHLIIASPKAVENFVTKKLLPELRNVVAAFIPSNESGEDLSQLFPSVLSHLEKDFFPSFCHKMELSEEMLFLLASSELRDLFGSFGIESDKEQRFLMKKVFHQVMKNIQKKLGSYVVNREQMEKFYNRILPRFILADVMDYLRHQTVEQKTIKLLLRTLSKRMGELVCQWSTEMRGKRAKMEKMLFVRVFPFLCQHFITKIQDNDTSVVNKIQKEILFEDLPGNLLSLLKTCAMSAEEFNSFLGSLVPQAYLEAVEMVKNPYDPSQSESILTRLPRLVSVLRLCTNSCWFHANDYFTRLYPQLKQYPFTLKYTQGIDISITVKSPENYTVIMKRNLLLDKVDKLFLAKYIAKVPVTWTINPHGNVWKGVLNISNDVEFASNATEIDKWQLIDVLIAWCDVQTDLDDPVFSPRFISSPRYSRNV